MAQSLHPACKFVHYIEINSLMWKIIKGFGLGFDIGSWTMEYFVEGMKIRFVWNQSLLSLRQFILGWFGKASGLDLSRIFLVVFPLVWSRQTCSEYECSGDLLLELWFLPLWLSLPLLWVDLSCSPFFPPPGPFSLLGKLHDIGGFLSLGTFPKTQNMESKKEAMDENSQHGAMHVRPKACRNSKIGSQRKT